MRAALIVFIVSMVSTMLWRASESKLSSNVDTNKDTMSIYKCYSNVTWVSYDGKEYLLRVGDDNTTVPCGEDKSGNIIFY